MKGPVKLFTLVLFVGTVMFPVYAFASSSLEGKASGEGASTISGWEVSNVRYQLSSDPSLVKGVSFDLDAPASSASVKLISMSSNYISCTNVNSKHLQCDFSSGVSISNMDELRVIAVGN